MVVLATCRLASVTSRLTQKTSPSGAFTAAHRPHGRSLSPSARYRVLPRQPSEKPIYPEWAAMADYTTAAIVRMPVTPTVSLRPSP